VRWGKLAQRSDRVASEARVGVHTVLEHEEVALSGQRRQPQSPFLGQVAARGVLAGRLEGHQLDLVTGEQALERVHVEAVLVHGHADHACAGLP
jgi:hypothetical protein